MIITRCFLKEIYSRASANSVMMSAVQCDETFSEQGVFSLVYIYIMCNVVNIHVVGQSPPPKYFGIMLE